MAVSESQKKANKSYREKNPKKNQYLSYRSTARSFINNHATLDDLEELKNLIIKKEIHSWISYIDETLLPIIDYGKGKGLFRVNTYIFADNSATLLKLGNTLKSLSSGKKGNKRPLEYYLSLIHI